MFVMRSSSSHLIFKTIYIFIDVNNNNNNGSLFSFEFVVFFASWFYAVVVVVICMLIGDFCFSSFFALVYFYLSFSSHTHTHNNTHKRINNLQRFLSCVTCDANGWRTINLTKLPETCTHLTLFHHDCKCIILQPFHSQLPLRHSVLAHMFLPIFCLHVFGYF